MNKSKLSDDISITSNQKEILYSHIINSVSPKVVKTVLDIGAGNGSLAKQLAETYLDYTAVEQNADFAKLLEKEGVRTIHTVFPYVLDRQYDFVLSSHSLPESINTYNMFVENAWRATANKGYLLFISFKGGDGLLRELRKQYLRNTHMDDDEKFERLVALLKQHSSVTIYRFESRWFCASLNALARFISDSIGGSEQQKIQYITELEKVISSLPRLKGEKFYFPMEHVSILVKKT